MCVDVCDWGSGLELICLVGTGFGHTTKMGCNLSQLKSRNKGGHYTEIVPKEMVTGAWRKLDSMTLSSWIKSGAERWGFQVDVDYISRQIRLQPWATRGRHFEVLLPAPLNTDDLDVKYTYSEILIEETGLWKTYHLRSLPCYKELVLKKYKYSPFLDVAQVIGCRDHVIVIQLVLAEVNQFLVVDLLTETITGYFEKKHRNKHCLFECHISPDFSTFLLKPSVLFQMKLKMPLGDDEVFVYSTNPDAYRYNKENNVSKQHNNQQSNVSVNEPDLVKISLCDEDHDTKVRIPDAVVLLQCCTLFPGNAKDTVLAYDPRFKNSRLGVASLNSKKELYISLYCITTRQFVHHCRAGQGAQRYQHLVFSPCGAYIAATNVFYTPDNNTFPKKFSFFSVHIYGSDNLILLQRLEGLGTLGLNSIVPYSLFPQFSTWGKYIAVGTCRNSDPSHVDVYKVGPVLNLQHRCRLVILELLEEAGDAQLTAIELLPLCQTLKNFLSFRPIK